MIRVEAVWMGLQCCRKEGACGGCPYHGQRGCISMLHEDALVVMEKHLRNLGKRRAPVHRAEGSGEPGVGVLR